MRASGILMPVFSLPGPFGIRRLAADGYLTAEEIPAAQPVSTVTTVRCTTSARCC